MNGLNIMTIIIVDDENEEENVSHNYDAYRCIILQVVFKRFSTKLNFCNRSSCIRGKRFHPSNNDSLYRLTTTESWPVAQFLQEVHFLGNFQMETSLL
jgi:hypothetical protein